MHASNIIELNFEKQKIRMISNRQNIGLKDTLDQEIGEIQEKVKSKNQKWERFKKRRASIID